MEIEIMRQIAMFLAVFGILCTIKYHLFPAFINIPSIRIKLLHRDLLRWTSKTNKAYNEHGVPFALFLMYKFYDLDIMEKWTLEDVSKFMQIQNMVIERAVTRDYIMLFYFYAGVDPYAEFDFDSYMHTVGNDAMSEYDIHSFDDLYLTTHEEFKETCRRLNEMYGSQYTLDSFKKIITKGFRFKPSTTMVDMIMFYVSKFVYVYLKQLGVESEEYKDFLMDMLGVRFDGESQWEENMQRLVTESEKRLGYFQEGLRKTDETAEDRGTSCY